MVAARRFASIEVEAKRLTKVILFWRGAIWLPPYVENTYENQ